MKKVLYILCTDARPCYPASRQLLGAARGSLLYGCRRVCFCAFKPLVI